MSKYHLALSNKAFCRADSDNILTKRELLQAKKDGKEVCKSCFKKANEKHILVDNELHESVKDRAEKENVSMKRLIEILLDK